ncbi:hypothetical protein ACOMHN_043789 [Nucella lapillus]
MKDPPESEADEDEGFGGALSSSLLPPEIVPSGNVVLQPGTNASIDCIGSAQLQWSWVPEPHTQQMFYPHNSVQSGELEVTDNGVYKRTLHFTDAQYFNTGVYNCDYTVASTSTASIPTPAAPTTQPPLYGGMYPGGLFPPFGDGGGGGGFPFFGGGGGGPGYGSGGKPAAPAKEPDANVKVFVSDEDNMFIKESALKIFFVSVMYGHRVAFPCAVSDPSFNVTLFSAIGHQDFTNKDGVTYDPVQGFIVASPYYVYAGTFKCLAKTEASDGSGEITEELKLVLKFKDTEILPPPQLIASESRLKVGEKFSLTCKIDVKPNTHVELYMIYHQEGTPDKDRVNLELPKRDPKREDHEYDEITLLLEIDNVTQADRGVYQCIAVGIGSCVECDDNRQQADIVLEVYEKSFVYLKPARKMKIVNDTVDAVYMFVAINAFPKPTLQWYHNGRLLVDSILTQMRQAFNGASLFILGPRSSHSGVYTLRAITPDRNASADINLLVYGKPEVTIIPVGGQHKEQVVTQAGTVLDLYCQVEGKPIANVSWFFQEVPAGNFTQNPGAWEVLQEDQWQLTSDLELQKGYVLQTADTRTGWFRCSALNEHGLDQADIKYIVSDSDKALTIFDQAPRPAVKGDSLRVVCRASLWLFQSLSISRFPAVVSGTLGEDGSPRPAANESSSSSSSPAGIGDGLGECGVQGVGGFGFSVTPLPLLAENGEEGMATVADVSPTFELEFGRTPYSVEVVAYFSQLKEGDAGCYYCHATDFNNVNVTAAYPLTLAPIRHPKILEYSSGVRRVSEMSTVNLKCLTSGYPPPSVTWFKDKVIIAHNSSLNVSVGPDGSLTLENVSTTHAGHYQCAASNYGGRVLSSNMTLRVGEDISQAGFSSIYVGVIIGTLIFLVIVVTVIVVFARRKTGFHKELEKYLIQPQGEYNPDLPIDEQTGCLPYDPKWELPKDRLRMGMILGQGAFGRVMKAEAMGIGGPGSVTSVAVKMVKDCTDKEQMMALLSELKILIHLGQHLNIVNLLGAVTKDIRFGELNVVVEYCHFGNLRSYLLKYKATFCDTMEDPLPPPSPTTLPPLSSPAPADQQDTLDPMADDSAAMYKDPDAPHYVNKPGEPGGSADSLGPPLTTKNLICWAFQVARGMEYLCSKKCIHRGLAAKTVMLAEDNVYIHRDLAARNVLLAEDNVVKICDFGLAKDCYKDDEYHKKGDGPVPVKWMALESLTHRLCTSKSDVWSYGIFLWEIFTLGGNPYPGIEINEKYISLLKSGYRMDKPKFASDDVYKVMLQTWNEDPDKRPSFSDLVCVMGDFLEANVKQYYLDLSSTYIKMGDDEGTPAGEGGGEEPVLDKNGYLRMSTVITAPTTTLTNTNTNNHSDYTPMRSSRPHSYPTRPLSESSTQAPLATLEDDFELDFKPHHYMNQRSFPREEGCQTEMQPLVKSSASGSPSSRPCSTSDRASGGFGKEDSPVQVHTLAEVHQPDDSEAHQPDDSDSGHSSSYAPGTSPVDSSGYLVPKVFEAPAEASSDPVPSGNVEMRVDVGEEEEEEEERGDDKDLRDSAFCPSGTLFTGDYHMNNYPPPDYRMVVEHGEQQDLPV